MSSLKSIYYSINKILNNKDINRLYAIYRYIIWQLIKIFNLFPRYIKISESKIQIPNKKIAGEGGTKLFTQGMYDFNNMNLIKFCTSIGKCNFFDIGANFGTYSIIASEHKEVDVYSFEPHPYTFQLLLNNIDINKRSNVHAYNFALSDEDTTVKFSNNPGSSTNKIQNDNIDISNIIEIEAVKISTFCFKNNIYPDIVKIDVEGFENKVISGFENYIYKVNLFVIEITENNNFIIDFMKNAGFLGPFSLSFKDKIFRKFHENSYEDVIFISPIYFKMLNENYGFKINEN
jgi:FkbM family methyltransferase